MPQVLIDIVPNSWSHYDVFFFQTVPPTRVNTTVRLEDLRREMTDNGIHAYIIPSEDAHQVTSQMERASLTKNSSQY